MKKAIGIDLGTTYSCVAVWQNGRPEVIANDQGNRTTPSYVSFNETERLIGESAKNQVSMNPQNTIFDAKRLIGRKITDPVLENDLKHWPFKVIKGENNKPLVQVTFKNELKTFTPEEISSMVLLKMKETAETYLGCEVTDAVITVPAYFSDAQRQATKDAGIIAGLNVLRIINEPTAAAIAYGLDKKDVEKYVLIFDTGGGTHDVSLLMLDGGVFQVKAVGGNSHLGGEDFDSRMVDYFVADFKKKHKKDLSTSIKAIRRLRTACEKAKRNLSSSMQASIEIDSLFDGIDYNAHISRAKFEELNADLFKETMKPVEKVLQDAKISKDKVGEIILVGGSTRIPKIQQMLSDYFGGKELNQSINPDECVAVGAACMAALLTNVNDKNLNELVLIDVTPLSLGLETVGGIMTNIIPRNSTIPCLKTKIFSTYSDNQSAVTVKVFEGERQLVADNNLLGTFDLLNIQPARRGEPQIEVTFDIDANGILTVTAIDKKTKNNNKIKISGNKGRLSTDEIARMIKEAEEYAEQDQIMKERIQSRNNLENYVYSVRAMLDDERMKQFITETDRNMLAEKITDAIQWLEANPSVEKADCLDRHQEIEKIWSQIKNDRTNDESKVNKDNKKNNKNNGFEDENDDN